MTPPPVRICPVFDEPKKGDFFSPPPSHMDQCLLLSNFFLKASLKVIVAEKTPKYEDKHYTFHANTSATATTTIYQNADRCINVQSTSKPYSSPSSNSCSSNSDCEEAIDDAIKQQMQSNVSVTKHTVGIEDAPINLYQYTSKIVVLGTADTIHSMSSTIMKQGNKNVLGCPISYNGGVHQYEELLQQLSVGDEVVFIWAFETKTGDIDDKLIKVFKDFLGIFASESVKSMIVVLWYPGLIENLRESIEDLTDIVRKTYNYNSPLGFPVLQYKNEEEFSSNLVQKLFEIQPFRITNIAISEENIEESTGLSQDQEIVIVSTDHVERASNDEDINAEVDNPVILVVGPPGHGKSSVANLVLGEEKFQVRGKDALRPHAIVQQGYLQKHQAFATVLEAPGFYANDSDMDSRFNVEFELRKIGYLTHVVVAWHVLELRYADFDFALQEILKLFGSKIVNQLIFAVTYCDSSSKAKKYRNKRGIFLDTIASMIRNKVADVFGTEEDPLIYFLCTKQPKDPSRKQLVNYLNGEQWPVFSMTRMAQWTNKIVNVEEDTFEEDNYEEVEEEVFYPGQEDRVKTTSKSMYDIASLPQDNLSRSKESLSKSFHSVQNGLASNHPSPPRNRRINVEKRNVFTSSANVGRRAGSSARGKGKSKSQGNLFRARSRSRSVSRSNFDIRESETNLYQESPNIRSSENMNNTPSKERKTSRGRGSQSGLFGTRSRSRSWSRSNNLNKTRSNLSMQESRSNLEDVARSNSAHPRQSSKEVVETDTLKQATQSQGRPYTRQRQRSGSSMGMGSMARRRGRSKSRERMRQSRSQQNIIQTSSLPRPNQNGEENQVPTVRRSRSNHSMRATTQRRQKKSGDCSVM